MNWEDSRDTTDTPTNFHTSLDKMWVGLWIHFHNVYAHALESRAYMYIAPCSQLALRKYNSTKNTSTIYYIIKDTELHSNLRDSSLLSSWRQMHQASTSPTHRMQNIVSIIQRIIHTRIYWIIKSVLWRVISSISTCKASTSRLSRVSTTKWYMYTDWSMMNALSTEVVSAKGHPPPHTQSYVYTCTHTHWYLWSQGLPTCPYIHVHVRTL